jgi:hypothetical protein
MLGEEDRDRLVWPDVVAATEMGDEGRYFVTVKTNNNETLVKVYIYWHVPADGPPALVVEVDDEPADSSDIYLRIRRNDGLVAQGTPDEMQYLREE